MNHGGAKQIADNLFPTQIADLLLSPHGGTISKNDFTFVPWHKENFSWENDFYKIENDMKKVFEKFSEDFTYGDTFPKINVYYDKKNSEYVIEASIAGINKNDVKVSIDSGRLIFEYVKNQEDQFDKENIQFFLKEMSTTSFRKTIKIPESADLEKVKNFYSDGIMKIVFPIKESAKTRQLTF